MEQCELGIRSKTHKHLVLTCEVLGLNPVQRNRWDFVRTCSYLALAFERNTKHEL